MISITKKYSQNATIVQKKKKKDISEVMTFKPENGINRQRKWHNPTQRAVKD